MFSKWRERLRHTLGLRVALWYAVVFVASSLALTALTVGMVLGALLFGRSPDCPPAATPPKTAPR